MPVDSWYQLDRPQLTSSGQTTPARPLKYAGPQLWEVQIKPGRPVLGVKLNFAIQVLKCWQFFPKRISFRQMMRVYRMEDYEWDCS